MTLGNVEESSGGSEALVLAGDLRQVEEQLDDAVLLLQAHHAAIKRSKHGFRM